MSFRPRLWPRSLFGRLALLLLAVIVISQLAAIYLFRQDRVALLARQFGDTKLVELRALRTMLASADPRANDATLARYGEAYHARIVADEERQFVGGPPQNPLLTDLQERLRTELGPDTELRIQPRLQLLWIKLVANDRAYWAGFQMPPRGEDNPGKALELSLIVLAVLLVSAYLFARYLARPLRQLNDAVSSLGRGRAPSPLPESGPSEIVNLNRGFNQMLASLVQNEQDRAVLLAGVSHDLRTPLARLRLGLEVGTQDEHARQAMIDDIEEIDRIIDQFLDFARDGHETQVKPVDLSTLIAALVERYARSNQMVEFRRAELPLVPLRGTAISRLVANLIDNALRHGAPPVEVEARLESGSVVIEVRDRGPGIPPEQVDRLKRPFARGNPARSGIPGAGLGLAIVERIARLHSGTLELVPRPGGGTVARVTLPVPAQRAKLPL
ncbi:MAG TPA: ATP-binding protein [Casimicrobiaceae bacterium]|nr:ATP-binding protein [Casimicrobiaceae bacterium]